MPEMRPFSIGYTTRLARRRRQQHQQLLAHQLRISLSPLSVLLFHETRGCLLLRLLRSNASTPSFLNQPSSSGPASNPQNAQWLTWSPRPAFTDTNNARTSAGLRSRTTRWPSRGMMCRLILPSSVASVDALLAERRRVMMLPALAAARYSLQRSLTVQADRS